MPPQSVAHPPRHLGERARPGRPAGVGPAAAVVTTLVVGLSFDVSVWEVWLNLMVGASVHMPEDEVRAEPEGVALDHTELGGDVMGSWSAATLKTLHRFVGPLMKAGLRQPVRGARWIRASRRMGG